MATNTLFLVRHGQNPANITREFSHRLVDYPLTELGVRQSEQTAAYFVDQRLDAIYTSPLRRAMHTAMIVGQATGLHARVVEAFREVNCGALEGQPPTDELWAIHDAIMAAWDAGDHDAAFPGGEDYYSLLARALRGIAEVTFGRANQRILVVTHGGIVMATLKDLCRDADLEAVRRVPSGNCSVTEIEVTRDGDHLAGRLVRWADVSHLLAD